jgi:nucleotide-binding universal stress UspA family protein
MKRILVPYDGSDGAKHAFDVALDFAGKYGADLLVLAIVRIPEPTTSLEMEGLLDNGQQHFKQDFAELRARAGSVPIRTEIEVGHPAEHIVARAEKEGVDLIVMGRRGRTRMGRFMLGSVSERVLRYAHCAVTIVK